MNFKISCDICCDEFNENVAVPKMLSCGHSFCLPCIENLLEFGPECPKCRKKMNKNKTAEDYPTVYLILDAVKLAKNVVVSQPSPQQLLKEKLDALKEKIITRKSKISANLDKINDHLALVEDLINQENEVTDVELTNNVLETLVKEYGKDTNQSAFLELRNSVDIKLNDYENSNKFLMEIYSQLENEKIIYAVKKVDDDVKYGKVSIHCNMILFHALTETKKPDNASLIWFDELKRCVTEDNLQTFLILSCNEREVRQTIIIEMMNSNLSSQFIRLCTGEFGPTYKGSPYEYLNIYHQNYFRIKKLPDVHELLQVKNYTYKESLTKGLTDYIWKQTNVINTAANDIYINGNTDGSFKIIRLLTDYSNLRYSPIGKVNSPTDFFNFLSKGDPDKLKIIDCGLILKTF